MKQISKRLRSLFSTSPNLILFSQSFLTIVNVYLLLFIYVSKHTVHNNGGIPEKVGFHDISSIQDKHELFCEIILMLPLPFHYSNLSEPEPMMGQSA